MRRAIREIQPRWVVGENVLGLVGWNGGMVFHEVQADLEAEGYEVQPFVLPAVSVNAPHRRDRVWFVAKNTRINGCVFGESIEKGAEVRQQRDISARDTQRLCGEEMAGLTADTNGIGRNNGSDNWGERQVPHDEERSATESESERCGRFGRTGEICIDGMLPTPMASDCGEKVTGLETQDSLVKMTRQVTGKPSQLSPQFVMEMMGFPTDWTELPFLNGDKSPSKPEEMP